MSGFDKIDHIIQQAENRIGNLYSRITPENSRQQKEQFLNEETAEPSFSYPALDYDTEALDTQLTGLDIPEGSLGTLYRKKIDEIRLKNQIVANIGDPDAIQRLTQQLYGSPSESLVRAAQELLHSINSEEQSGEIPADKVRDEIQKVLDQLGMDDWQVSYYQTDAKTSTSVKPSEKTIYLQKDRKFDRNAPERQAVHEGGVHALRSANGFRQDHYIFGIGVPGYMATEEGLATYMEELTGNLDKNTLRKYAGRVIAVNAVLDDRTFRDTYHHLHQEHDFSQDMAWEITKRAYRAGGFIKDHVYFEGRQKIKQYDGNLDHLFVGKVAVDDIDQVRDLLRQGVLRQNRYTPGDVLAMYSTRQDGKSG
ncbi:MAG: DUF1704 domain-containing protein [Candidatus Nanohaloarchaea archaeon]|nr:DUF1704 domain-containing protein [Candidatus Nanohaloarchaea archaeon]